MKGIGDIVFYDGRYWVTYSYISGVSGNEHSKEEWLGICISSFDAKDFNPQNKEAALPVKDSLRIEKYPYHKEALLELKQIIKNKMQWGKIAMADAYYYGAEEEYQTILQVIDNKLKLKELESKLGKQQAIEISNNTSPFPFIDQWTLRVNPATNTTLYKPFSDKWMGRLMAHAKSISAWSKDPNTKVGAVVASLDKRILSQGYNGFPRGIEDTHARLNFRPTKLDFTIHAEMNAFYNASRSGIKLDEAIMFVYGLPTCSECAKGIIQSGIKCVVVAKSCIIEGSKWIESWELSKTMFLEAGVGVVVFDDKGL